MVRVWRLADGAPVGEPVGRYSGSVNAVAVSGLPEGTPAGKPISGHVGSVNAVAAGGLPDGTPVMVSGGDDGTVRVWRLADGTPVVPPLYLSKQVRGVAAHGNVIITAAGADIAVHQITLPRPMR